ncbi:hypothetical protein [Roseateles sp.]|mgnify:FL=1|uniref:hypothetical protein n=1 Tax=Roseateles sp. TaxID=1971397 RepID=UPI00396488A4
MQWRLSRQTSLHWLHFDGAWCVFDEGSSQTLVADPVLAGTLMALESGCQTDEDIEQQVFEDLGNPHRPTLQTQIHDALSFLDSLGLVESAL